MYRHLGFQFLVITNKATVYRFLCEYHVFISKIFLLLLFYSFTLYSDILLDLDSPAPVTTPASAPVSASNDLWGDFSTASRYEHNEINIDDMYSQVKSLIWESRVSIGHIESLAGILGMEL